MNTTVSEVIKQVVHHNQSSAFELSVQIIRLEVIQGEVARLIDRIDEITHKGWDKDRAMSYLAIKEIQDKVRLIDMAFNPLFGEISEVVTDVKDCSLKLYEQIIGDSN